jgi:hypothetical protein
MVAGANDSFIPPPLQETQDDVKEDSSIDPPPPPPSGDPLPQQEMATEEVIVHSRNISVD